MPNHFHLVLRTGAVPLARVMARIGTGYALGFNRRHDRVGHLFQNRYKSIRVDEDAHLLALVRYVHMNPLRAGLVPSLAALAHHPWTGYAALLGHADARFQDTATILRRFGPVRSEARRRLVAWMRVDPEPIPEADAAADGLPEPQARPLPDSALLEDLRHLVARVCRGQGVAEADLWAGDRARSVAAARQEIVQRACRELGMRDVGLARALGLSKSAVSKIRSRRRRPPG